MTTENDNLERMLKTMRVPDPDEDAKERAVKAAVRAFVHQGAASEKKIKGISLTGRLTGKKQKGDPTMKTESSLMFKTAFAGVMVAVIVAIAVPTFMASRKRGAGPVSVQELQRSDTASQQTFQESETRPAPEYALSKTDREAGEGYAPGLPVTGPRPAAPPAERLRFSTDAAGDHEQTVPSMPDQTYVGRDRFETLAPNPIKVAAESPVSTFSIDVDTAAYAFVRRTLHSGHLPQKNAVRIEELINYFDYDYPVPADRSAPFQPSAAVFPSPWNPDNRLLVIGIKGYQVPDATRPRSNLVFLIDVSGSMNQPDKLPLLKNAFAMLVESLRPDDVVSMVVYAGAAGTVLDPTPVRRKAKILTALDRLHAGGSTAGGEGIRQAYALAEANFDPEGVNRVILATDGDFNVGIRDPEALNGFVERKRRSGVYLSVLGFGQGNYNDALMQKLAQNGNGNAAYIDTLNEARKVLVDEAQSTLFTIAKDVKIQVEFNPATVAEYRLIGYETRMLRREDFNNDRVDAGDVGAGHTVTAIYEFTPAGGRARMVDGLRYSPTSPADDAVTAQTGTEYAFLKIRYKRPDQETSRLIALPLGLDLERASVDEAPAEARFAAAVAGFGQLLRGDPYLRDFTYDDVIALGRSARGQDAFGYRAGFLDLVRLAKTARPMGDR